MKSLHMLFVCLFATSLCATFVTGTALSQDKKMPMHKGSEELQKIKALAGTWVGEMDMGKGPQKAEIVYRVTAAGSAVMETFNPGTPMEMVTMYHDQKGKLVMTHYCMLGNQPKMILVEASDKQLVLDLEKESEIKEDEPHMNALTIDFIDSNKIKHTWGCCQGGGKTMDMSVEFKRRK